MRSETQIAAGGFDVAQPVALPQQAEFVEIERRGHCALAAEELVAQTPEGAHAVQEPLGGGDAQHAVHAHFALQQAAELAAVVAATVAQEVGPTTLTARERRVAGVDEVAHVDEREALRTIAHGEVDVLANAVGHEEIVALARAVDAGGAEDDVVQPLHTGEGFLGLEL